MLNLLCLHPDDTEPDVPEENASLDSFVPPIQGWGLFLSGVSFQLAGWSKVEQNQICSGNRRFFLESKGFFRGIFRWKGCFFSIQLFFSAGIRTWSVENVGTWLQDECEMGRSVVSTFGESNVDGEELYNMTLDDVRNVLKDDKLVTRFGEIILEERDKRKDLEIEMATQEARRERDDVGFVEQFRPIDLQVTLRDMYRENAAFERGYLSRPGNRIQPVRCFKMLSSLELGDASDMKKLAEETVKFAAACLNSRTNGCIHFGVEPGTGTIRGIPLTCHPAVIENQLAKHLKVAFQDHQLITVMQAIRPVKFVKVFQGTTSEQGTVKKFVLEVEVVPHSRLTGKEAFWCTPPSVSRKKSGKAQKRPVMLFDFAGEEPTELQDEELSDFISKRHPALVEQRAQAEAEDLTSKKIKTDIPELEKKKLIDALCLGEESLRGGEFYHFLILSPPEPGQQMDEATLKENMKFLSTIQWSAVLDVTSDCAVFNFMQDEEGNAFKTFLCEDMDSTRAEMLHEETAQFYQPLWIFLNGRDDSGPDSVDRFQWKDVRFGTCREWINFFTQEFEPSRCVFVFPLLSKNFDITLMAATEICVTHKRNTCFIAETSSVLDPFLDKLGERSDTEKGLFDDRSVVMDWSHVSAVVDEISDQELTAETMLTTKDGAKVPLPEVKKNEMSNLAILSAKQCEGVVKTEKDKREKEHEFYRGGVVDWWNFYLPSQVCHRSLDKKLEARVRESLEGRTRIMDGVAEVNLYHEPGAGGTTSARRVLWELRANYRCAVVKAITKHTCEQIFDLHSFGERQQEGSVPKPVLLLLDNQDEEKTEKLKEEIREQTWVQQKSRSDVFCVLLLVHRTKRVKLPENEDKKDFSKFTLKQQLEETEKEWFKEKYNEIKARDDDNDDDDDPETMLALNIMKNDFDRTYVEEKMRQILKNITSEKERKLILVLALLNTYDLEHRRVKKSPFDQLMCGIDVKRPATNTFGIYRPNRRRVVWERHLSSCTQTILNVNAGKMDQTPREMLCVFHPLMSEAILKILQEPGENSAHPQGTRLSNLVLDMLDQPFIQMKYVKSIQELVETNIAEMLKNRDERDGSGDKRKLPLLSDDIIKQEKNHQPAVEVLNIGFERTNDPYVCQQAARVLIDAQEWDKAEEMAKQARDAKPKSSWLWHTYGKVFESQLRVVYKEIKERNDASVDEVLKAARFAFESTRIYERVKELHKTRGSTTSRNLAGHFDELHVGRTILECFTYMKPFSCGRKHPARRKRLVAFLSNPNDIPEEIRDWPPQIINFVKELSENLPNTFQEVEDELTQIKLKFLTRTRRRDYEKDLNDLRGMQKSLQRYLESDVDLLGDKKKTHGRSFLLKGMSFREILYEGERGPIHLFGLREDVESLQKRRPQNDTVYHRCLIGIHLVCACLYPEEKWISYRNLQTKSQQLYRSDLPKDSLEPYLYYVLLNWKHEDTREVQQAITEWEMAFHHRYPQAQQLQNQEKPVDVFYMAEGEGFESIVSASVFRKFVNRETNGETYFFRSDLTQQRLARFSGMPDNVGKTVRLYVNHKGKRQPLSIPLYRPLTHNKFLGHNVTFFLGFTWCGPRAFDVRREDRQEGTAN